MLYTWNSETSAIRNVEIFAVGAKREAFIYAPEVANQNSPSANSNLSTMTEALQQAGFIAQPDEINGKHVLRIEKIGTPKHFLDTLARTGIVSGTPSVIKSERDPKPKSWGEWMRENTMVASGWAYLAGDGLLVLAGLLRRDAAEVSTGAMWGSTGVALAFFGKKKPENQLEIFYKNLGEYLRKEGVALDPEQKISFAELSRKDGTLSKIQEYLYNNPVEFNNSIQTLGGLTMIKAGWNQDKNMWKMAAGVSVANGQFWGMMINPKEKPQDLDNITHTSVEAILSGQPLPANANIPQENDPERLPPKSKEKSLPQQVIDWFHEKPLRITGFGASANNILNVLGAFFHERDKVEKWVKHFPQHITDLQPKINALKSNEAYVMPIESNYPDTDKAAYHKARKSYLAIDKEIKGLTAQQEKIKETVLNPLPGNIRAWQLNLATAGCYLVANALYGMSPKGNAANSLRVNGVLEEMMGMAANVVAIQPREAQADMIGRIAGFFSAQTDVDMRSGDIAMEIAKKVHGLQTNPFYKHKVNSPVHMGPLIANQTSLSLPAIA